MEPEPKTLFGPFLLWIFTLGGAAVMVKGVLWAVYANSSVMSAAVARTVERTARTDIE